MFSSIEAADLSQIRQLITQGEFEQAADLLKPLVHQAELAGGMPSDLLREAGLVSVGLRDYHGALVYLDAALRGGDRDLNTLGMLADVAHHLKCPQVVIDHLGRCAHPLLGSRWARALATLFRFQDAETVMSQLPDADNDPIVGEVRTLIAVGRYDERRLEIAEDAAQRFPTIPMIWGHLAAARQSFGDTAGACVAYQRALVLEPDYPPWHYNYALSLMSAGEYRAGFREYEWRMHPSVDRKLVAHLPISPGGLPLWRGESLNEKCLVLYAEGGIGDAILALRFINTLNQLGIAELRVLVPTPLLEMCRRIWPRVAFDSKGEQTFFVGADFWVPTLSLPDRFATQFESVPYRERYLSACTEKTEYWREQIKRACHQAGKQRALAMVWHGRVEHDYERTRAYSAEQFAAKVPADTLPVLIQIEASEEALAAFGTPVDYLWVGKSIRSFEDTAAILVACDDGIFCDTSTAHLAGALGLPMQVLIKNRFIWQWKCLPNGQAAWYEAPRIVFEEDGRVDEIVYARAPEVRTLAGQVSQQDSSLQEVKTCL